MELKPNALAAASRTPIPLKPITRGTFCSVPELIRAIDEHTAQNNAHPKPFEWHASADLILGKVAPCKEALGAGH